MQRLAGNGARQRRAGRDSRDTHLKERALARRGRLPGNDRRVAARICAGGSASERGALITAPCSGSDGTDDDQDERTARHARKIRSTTEIEPDADALYRASRPPARRAATAARTRSHPAGCSPYTLSFHSLRK